MEQTAWAKLADEHLSRVADLCLPLRERLGDVSLALEDLERYVAFRPGARDIRTVSETVRSLRKHTDDDSADREPADGPAA